MRTGNRISTSHGEQFNLVGLKKGETDELSMHLGMPFMGGMPMPPVREN
jgi:hypothetical protein